jgi:hypothetical protein
LARRECPSILDRFPDTRGSPAHAPYDKHGRAIEQGNQEKDQDRKYIPQPESALRLVAAMLMETSDQWLNGKRYLPAEQANL